MSTIADVAADSAWLNGEVSDILGGSAQGDDHDSPGIFFKARFHTASVRGRVISRSASSAERH